jgi:hypothetical protein
MSVTASPTPQPAPPPASRPTWIAALGTLTTLVVLMATTLVLAPTALADSSATGLWPTSFRPHETAADCGRWQRDGNGFCVADDTRNGLEVGVRFQTSHEVAITGVRIYRYDPSTIRGSLWDSSGELLARGTFGPGPTSAWQDMEFASPVTIEPGRTYIASYFTPKTRYAFEYGYFTNAGRTVGPITALQATSAQPNGIHCYDDAACGSFPVRAFRDSTYWVTPLWRDPALPATPAVEPRVVRVSPGTSTVATRPTIRLTFSKSMRHSTLTRSTVRLVGKHGRVAVRLRYDAARHQLVVKPRAALRPGATYRLVVSTRVLDLHGNRLDQDPGRTGLQEGRWTFRTR